MKSHFRVFILSEQDGTSGEANCPKGRAARLFVSELYKFETRSRAVTAMAPAVAGKEQNNIGQALFIPDIYIAAGLVVGALGDVVASLRRLLAVGSVQAAT